MFERRRARKSETAPAVQPRYVVRSGDKTRYAIKRRETGMEHSFPAFWILDTETGVYGDHSTDWDVISSKVRALNAGRPYIFDTLTGEKRIWDGAYEDCVAHAAALNRAEQATDYRQVALALVRVRMGESPGVWEIREDVEAFTVVDPKGNAIALCGTRAEAEAVQRLAYELLAMPGGLTPRLASE